MPKSRNCVNFEVQSRGFKAQKAGYLVKKGRWAIDKWGKNTLPKNLIRTIKGGH